MAINLEPAVGRILVGRGRSTEFFPWYERAGRITKISGQRVYYEDPETKKEKFLHEYSAVVDTAEEEETLLKWTAERKEHLEALRAQYDMQSAAMWNHLNSSKVKSISPRISRTRNK